MSAFPGGFNPAIDRYDRRSVARLFLALVILTSDYWGAVALTPACYRLEAAGLELSAVRPDPKGGE
jgi:hypothetical protein